MPAKSENQQQAAGIALAVKRGETPLSSLRGASKQMYYSMTSEELHHLAATKTNFVWHEDIWFFADQTKILYCPKDNLRWDNWITIVLESNDVFDFWLKEKGKLFWCGKHSKREIVRTQPVRIQLCGYWNGEYWMEYK